MSATIRLLIVDDQSMVRIGLRTMLDAEDDIVVVGDARDGEDAVAKAEEHRPDVVLMDIRMPGMDGIEATRRIVASGTAGAVVMITTFDDEEYLLDSVRAGAFGFLLKDAGADLLATAVRTASRGDTLIDPAMTRPLLEHRLQAVRNAEPVSPSLEYLALRDRLDSLSERERTILGAVARGLSNAAIAGEAFLSEATVKSHVSSILLKTGTSSRLQAAVFAYETGFVRPEWRGAR